MGGSPADGALRAPPVPAPTAPAVFSFGGRPFAPITTPDPARDRWMSPHVRAFGLMLERDARAGRARGKLAADAALEAIERSGRGDYFIASAVTPPGVAWSPTVAAETVAHLAALRDPTSRALRRVLLVGIARVLASTMTLAQLRTWAASVAGPPQHRGPARG